MEVFGQLEGRLRSKLPQLLSLSCVYDLQHAAISDATASQIDLNYSCHHQHYSQMLRPDHVMAFTAVTELLQLMTSSASFQFHAAYARSMILESRSLTTVALCVCLDHPQSFVKLSSPGLCYCLLD